MLRIFEAFSTKGRCYSHVRYVNTFVFAGYKVYVHGTSCTPYDLLEALVEHGTRAKLKDVELIHIHLEGDGKWNRPEYAGKLSVSREPENRAQSAADTGAATNAPVS